VNRAVFFDRDGVLNQAVQIEGKPYPPASVNELIINSEASEALGQLKAAGFLLIGVTNQPDVARGQTSKECVELINRKLLMNLPLDDIRVCYHDDKDECTCRKPKPGLILQAADDFSIDVTQSYMVGDRWRDIEAGKDASCKSIWLINNYLEKKPETMDYSADSLLDVAQWILKN
jgi:D-glycero-D-manno-heptose 1,7-bisphosphate phosphatase